MSSFNSGIFPCHFGGCGGDCERVDVECDDGEDVAKDKGENNGGVKGSLSPLPTFHFGVLSLSPPSRLEDLPPFCGLELSP